MQPTAMLKQQGVEFYWVRNRFVFGFFDLGWRQGVLALGFFNMGWRFTKEQQPRIGYAQHVRVYSSEIRVSFFPRFMVFGFSWAVSIALVFGPFAISYTPAWATALKAA